MAHYDVLIKNANVFDGSGAPPFQADIGIHDNRIAAIGDLSTDTGGLIFAAAGLSVAPGFIDTHTHSDMSALYNPSMTSMISQGVTTQVVGNCGLCLGMTTKDPLFIFEQRWQAAYGVEISWSSLTENLRRVEENGIATNYLTLAGHGTLRKKVMGLQDRQPDSSELEQMKKELAEAMEAGAWGISTGLEYPPSAFAKLDELVSLAEVVQRYGGIYASHLRNEGDYLLESVEEAIAIGERAGIPVQLSHHKAEGRQNWGKVDQTLERVMQARTAGLDVQLDQYPYTAFMTSMSVQFLPQWVNEGDHNATIARLKDPVQRAAILEEIRRCHPDWDDMSEDSIWYQVMIGVCRSNRSIQGHTVAELAAQDRKNPIEYILDIILAERNMISAINFAISERDIERLLRFPYTMIGSDAVGAHPDGKMLEDRIHPRCYGTFPRVLGHYVRDRQVITEAEAIHKMTGMPATRLKLKDRGFLKPSYFADITIYDPALITDKATFENPHLISSGIEAVFVNGRLVFRDGEMLAARPGMVLRHN